MAIIPDNEKDQDDNSKSLDQAQSKPETASTEKQDDTPMGTTWTTRLVLRNSKNSNTQNNDNNGD